jgi:serine/threonine protein kinase
VISPVTIDGPRMPVRDLVGGFIGKYRVLRQLGKGGMGTVYEAVHNEIGQRAAIKVLHAKLADDTGYAKRFLDEARAVSIVDHPGLVKVFDFNQSSDGTVYLMMEYLEGEPLWQRMTRLRDRGERMSRTEVLRVSRQLASALAAVHAKGIVHRDLKPDNIVLVADPDTAGGERVKILDFGIAKFNEGAEGRRQTTTGTAIGTPTYMSPEQCEGLPKISDRADTYSLGVMMFENMASVEKVCEPFPTWL